MPSRFARLSTQDLTNLAVEAAGSPMQVAVVARLDGAALLDADGVLRRADIDARLRAGVEQAPILRRIVHRGGPLTGRPVWADDPAFDLARHVAEIVLPGPGDEAALLGCVEEQLGRGLDLTHPLWRVCLVTGLADGNVGLVVVLHHAVADGLAALRLVTTLLGQPPYQTTGPWAATRVPRWHELAIDNASATLHAVRRSLQAVRTKQPWLRLRRSLQSACTTLSQARAAPRTSLNAPVGSHRRIAVMRMDLAEVKRVGAGHHATVNDVALSVIAGGLRAVLDSRGEQVAGVRLHVGVAVGNRVAGDESATGNQAGVIVVRLPLDPRDPSQGLADIARETATAKRSQSVAGEHAFMAVLARSGLTRLVTRRQRMTNVVQSNVAGPPSPVEVLGATALEMVPFGVVAGNLAVGFLAFSYSGQFSVSVTADADVVPDLPVIIEGMRGYWKALSPPAG